MPQFKDATGRAWSVAVTGSTVKRCGDLLKIDIGDPLTGDPSMLTRMDTDIAFLVDLLFVVCKPEADQRGVTDEQFAELLGGDVLYHARQALVEALVDFFRCLRRPHVAEALLKQSMIVDRAVQLAEQTLTGDKFSQFVNSQMEELGKRFANLLESSD